jgi:hypothetical protein
MIDDAVKLLAQGANFGSLAVHLASGAILNHVMWVDATDEHLLINTEVHRDKYRAMMANPDVTVAIWDASNPFRYCEVRGTVVGEVRGPEAREHIDRLSQKYAGRPYQMPITSERVMIKIAPQRQRTQ